MDLTLDYNIELFPLKVEQSFALALAASLSRTGPIAGEDGAEAERNVWRPDRKGKTGGLDDDYDYVMYGKVRLVLHFLSCRLGSLSRFINSMVKVVKLCKSFFQSSCFSLTSNMDYRTAYASFGGLLMSLTGSFRHMTSIVLGDPVYLLMRK
jgi:DNA-directed RNA polymerase I, II, and III subunit RPABC3